MKTKLFTAFLCAMCIGLIGCNNKSKEPEQSVEESLEVNEREVWGYKCYEVIYQDGSRIFYRLFDEVASPKDVYITAGWVYYQTTAETYDYKGDFIVPASFTYKNTTYNVVGVDGLKNGSKRPFVGAFGQCKQLTSVTLPSSVKFIGKGAFKESPKLTMVNLSTYVEKIENEAFAQTPIKSITIPASITKLGENIFYMDTIDIHIKATNVPTCCLEEGNPHLGEHIKKIYVPSASVTAYKAAWYQCANIIEGE